MKGIWERENIASILWLQMVVFIFLLQERIVIEVWKFPTYSSWAWRSFIFYKQIRFIHLYRVFLCQYIDQLNRIISMYPKSLDRILKWLEAWKHYSLKLLVQSIKYDHLVIISSKHLPISCSQLVIMLFWNQEQITSVDQKATITRGFRDLQKPSKKCI